MTICHVMPGAHVPCHNMILLSDINSSNQLGNALIVELLSIRSSSSCSNYYKLDFWKCFQYLLIRRLLWEPEDYLTFSPSFYPTLALVNMKYVYCHCIHCIDTHFLQCPGSTTINKLILRKFHLSEIGKIAEKLSQLTKMYKAKCRTFYANWGENV